MSALALAGGSARYEGCEAKDDCAYSVDIDTFAEDVKIALAEIAQQTISCTFSLGDHGLEEAPTVQLTSAGGSTDIAFDTSHDNGWDWLSYDQIKLYGDACEQFKATPSAKVQVMAGCADARR
jgi:hypothetical protein